MIIFTLAFLLGDLYLQTFSQLPNFILLTTCFVMAMLLWLMLPKNTYTKIFLAFSMGLLWTNWVAHHVLHWQLPKEMEAKPVQVIGYISSLPQTYSWGKRFIFAIEEINFAEKKYFPQVNVQLSWQNADQNCRVGDRYLLMVKLKRIHGSQNPGGFDFEAWAMQKKLRAKGNVISSQANHWLRHDNWIFPINQFRQTLANKIDQHLPMSKTAVWLKALMIGEHNAITKKDWQILRNTGTNHLMAIAGLHIGIIAGITFFIFDWLWRRHEKLMLKMPAKHAASYCALFFACIYSLIAGFSLPTQRACIMLCIFTAAVVSRKKIPPWHVWSLALLCVLILNPLVVLTESFWLSFGTIALIIYGMQNRLAPSGFWWKWGRVQWVIGVGLIPLTLILFQQCSLISFVANTIAIPWLTFFILPLCFLATLFIFVSPAIAKILLQTADQSLQLLWQVLATLSQLPMAVWHHDSGSYVNIMLACLGVIILLLPAGFKGKFSGFIFLLPIIFSEPKLPAADNFWLTVLDVGQGLSVVVQTKHHLLLYDTGPNFGESFDAGENIVLPFLFSIGAKKINTLVISHADNDHAGGAKAILAAFKIKNIFTSAPEKINFTLSDRCHEQQSWTWDGVKFKFIYPDVSSLNLGNDSSCVLLIENIKNRVLLTGDIEKYAEKKLLENPNNLSADVLIAPHHGSKTSALTKFITAIHPSIVVFATGYRNRYHFPHPSVITAYKKIKAQQLNTAETGAIQFHFTNEGNHHSLYRSQYRRYWHD